VLVLTRELGQSVHAADGCEVGLLRDLTARLGAGHPTVHRLAVGSRRHVRHLVPWSAVAAFERSGVQLRDLATLDAFAVDGRTIPLLPDELLLVRDVLDTQVVDVVGHRLARVSDVLLTRLPDGRLELAAVDVGIGAICRRLGLRRMSEKLPERAIDWRDLHLTSDRGHLVQLASTGAAVHRLDARGLAELLTRLDLDSATDVIKAVGPARAAEAVTQAHPTVGGRIMLALEPGHAARVIDGMPHDSASAFRQVLGSRSPTTHRRYSRMRGWRQYRPRGPEGAGHHSGKT
jgi:hypothetical protein